MDSGFESAFSTLLQSPGSFQGTGLSLVKRNLFGKPLRGPAIPLRGQSLPWPSPPRSLGPAPPIPQSVPSCPHPPSLPGLLTMGFLNSLGLMQRTKKGWQAPSVRISSSSDRLNWLLSVGERFLVSAPWGDGPQRWEGLTLAPPALQKGSRRGHQQSGPEREPPREAGWLVT